MTTGKTSPDIAFRALVAGSDGHPRTIFESSGTILVKDHTGTLALLAGFDVTVDGVTLNAPSSFVSMNGHYYTLTAEQPFAAPEDSVLSISKGDTMGSAATPAGTISASVGNPGVAQSSFKTSDGSCVALMRWLVAPFVVAVLL